jgi:PBP1b-binding outer membrane lipoprotein LpoB
MNRLLLSLSLLAVLAVGCNDSATKTADKDKSVPTTEAAESDDSKFLAEVDKDALESAIAANPVTLIEFTAVW